MQNISLIVTVLNESETILELLDSIALQEMKVAETIIIDGGSQDDTVKKITHFANKNPQLNITCKVKKGNRSVGRNYAVRLAKHELIAITDAGCVLDKNWLKELAAKYKTENRQHKKTPVIAGYYASAESESTVKKLTDFQMAVVPYVLVMPDKVNPENFLPATRSMLIEKKVFQNIGGFDESLFDNEDYAFAKKLQSKKFRIGFSKEAIVYWMPRKTLKEFYYMIFRFARGDVFAGIVRPKVVLIFLRYVLFLFLFALSGKLFLSILCFYIVWAIQKNKKYVAEGWKYLPLLQITSDIAVMHGSCLGVLQRFQKN